jgi:D-alanyl-D-alanine carboxypeptidase/D-alanyl-D-alanine-endopeptidase (penicillin-binding protein 4)
MELRLMQRFAASIAIAFLTACATSSPVTPAPSLSSFIEERIATPPFQHALWAILIEESDGRVLYERNSHVLVMPASNRKMFTAATAISCLGETTRLETTLLVDGDDIVLRGGGDPSMGAWRYGREGDLDELAAAVRQRGIRTVRDVIADPSRFDRVTLPGGWKLGNLLRPYSAPVDAIAWRENDIDDNAPPEPALLAAMLLRDALVDAGIEVRGSARLDVTPRPQATRIAKLQSPELRILLAHFLKDSDNLYGEMFLKQLAPAPASYDAAFAIERRFLSEEAGLDPDEFSFYDGSGLAPDNLITASSAVKILRWMNHPYRASYWWTALTTPGEGGTLHRRLGGLEQRFRGKTGTINGVNALSGIVKCNDGKTRYVSVIANHHTGASSDATKIIDAIVQKVAAIE